MLLHTAVFSAWLDDLLAYTIPTLNFLTFLRLQDIWHDIHSLLPLPDAARLGCVSRAFLSSWRCHPNLTFSMKTLGLVRRNALYQEHKLAQSFTNRVNRIMKKHSGFGVKTFQLETCGDDFTPSDLDRWLQIAVTPGIEEVKISHAAPSGYYNFPCSLLFNGSVNSIQQLCLISCAFHPMAGLSCLRRLRLCYVHITGDELGCLLSNSFAMEELVLNGCILHRLNYLQVFGCKALKVVENKAPNLCSVCIDGALVQFPPGDLLQSEGPCSEPGYLQI
ncbi:hypothetical protein BRADI_2g07548v3 [Brachypodium distachyon]|uniref:At1g61320/AtMIF1 LRR domain-containing protein n=1 Tax=Brachypodium distachyon TaxID=15368 RepID=A0A0Q3FYH6_BRADI|nr:hypothetical protein BRADI_2g07548v3 [Brachypodium distachyon]